MEAVLNKGGTMSYTSEEFIEDVPTLSRKQVLKLLSQHGAQTEEYADFDRDLGVKDTYLSRKVFGWLGY